MVKDLCFEIIETCLNNCKFCSSNSNNKKAKKIEFKDYKRTIDYFMSTGGIEELSLSGGEPFLHPDLLKMVAYAKSYGIRTVIFTSGVIHGESLSHEAKQQLEQEMSKIIEEIDENEPENVFLKGKVRNYYKEIIRAKEYSSIDRKILRHLKEIGLDKIVFDMQSYEAETDNSIMGRGEASHQALLKSLIDASFEELNIGVHFIPMKPNYKEIVDILELLEIAGVNEISLLNFVPQGRGRRNAKNLLLTSTEKQEFFKLLNSGKNKYSGHIRVGIPLQGEETHRCNAGLEKIDITVNGDVLPCPAFKELTLEECKRYGITIPNIYTDLERINVPGKGKRERQLCKQVYEVSLK